MLKVDSAGKNNTFISKQDVQLCGLSKQFRYYKQNRQLIIRNRTFVFSPFAYLCIRKYMRVCLHPAKRTPPLHHGIAALQEKQNDT